MMSSDLDEIILECSITGDIMDDPVIDPEGNSYERAAILSWLERSRTSPVTRSPLNPEQLVPNRALKAVIAATQRNTPTSTELLRTEAKTPETGEPQTTNEAKIPEIREARTSEASDANGTTAVASSIGALGTRLTVQVARAGAGGGSNTDVLLSVQPPTEGAVRRKVDVVAVVDVSGSMRSAAELRGEHGAMESFGLSILDVVKHAVRTVVRSLLPGDRLGVVAYSSTARVALPLVAMDSAGQAQAESVVGKLTPGGRTNLWGGLSCGLDMLTNAPPLPGRASAVLLLTDGRPNIVPPRGHLPMFRRYTARHGLRCSLSTFGFGYSLDSQLLRALAVAGDGSYSFIPDASFVGTAFVHAVANLLTRAASQATVTLTLHHPDAAFASQPAHPYPVLDGSTSQRLALRVGPLQYGQGRDILLRVRGPPGATLSAELDWARSGVAQGSVAVRDVVLPSAQQGGVAAAAAAAGGAEGCVAEAMEVQRGRLRLVRTLHTLLAAPSSFQQPAACAAVRDLCAALAASPARAHPQMVAMAADATGQISQAVSRADWFQRWGQHYLPSLARAHLLQQCNNFKDPGVQSYGSGELFEGIRDEADRIFLTLPPPEPSIRRQQQPAPSKPKSRSSGRSLLSRMSRSSHSAAVSRSVVSRASARCRASPVRSMAAFHDSSRPCFAGDCLVALADGGHKRVDELRRGDCVAPATAFAASTDCQGSGSGPPRVVCVVKTPSVDGAATLVQLPGGLKITSWHPVYVEGQWQHPCEMVPDKLQPCPAVYSFVLSHGHTLNINGVTCVTLAHSFTGPVVGHEYFGSHRVLAHLKAMQGWGEGLVTLRADAPMLRDAASGMVIGLQEAQL